MEDIEKASSRNANNPRTSRIGMLDLVAALCNEKGWDVSDYFKAAVLDHLSESLGLSPDETRSETFSPNLLCELICLAAERDNVAVRGYFEEVLVRRIAKDANVTEEAIREMVEESSSQSE